MRRHMKIISLMLLGISILPCFGMMHTYAEEMTEEMITESETETETEEDAGPEIARIPQGIYEIACATDSGFIWDVKYCTKDEHDSKYLQMFRPKDVNQQKFYLEKLPHEQFRISVLSSGDALSISENGLTLATMEHPEENGFSENQSWIFRKAGNGLYYIQAANGGYLTLDKSRIFNGDAVVLSDFTGNRLQKWSLQNSWISSVNHEDTDLVNPYAEDGPYNNMSLGIRFGTEIETVTAEDFAAHTSLSEEEHTYTVDTEFLTPFAERLAEKYDTAGKPRRFITAKDHELTLVKGDFGWKLDVSGTANLLKENMQTNSHKTFDPIWAHEAGAFANDDPDAINDIGDSYVEVSLSEQKVWLFENGKQILETDCVSGTYGTDRQTPGGVYSIYYKQSPAVLNGPGYSSPVDFWMPFNGGIGLHNASWRSEFGGEIYKTNGSHGCINLPYEAAETIYNTVSKGYPVVCYYLD